MELTDQEKTRRENLAKIRELGIDPYPAALFPVTHLATEIKEQVEMDDEGQITNLQDVALAGRIMSQRIMGKAAFANLQDSSGRIQLYVSRDDIAPEEDKTMYNTVFKKLLDLGDFIGVKGFVFKTRTGEISASTSRNLPSLASRSDHCPPRRRMSRVRSTTTLKTPSCATACATSI